MIITERILLYRHASREIEKVLSHLQEINWSKVIGGAPEGLKQDVTLICSILDMPESQNAPDHMNVIRWIIGFFDIALAEKCVGDMDNLKAWEQLASHIKLLIYATGLDGGLTLIDPKELYVRLTSPDVVDNLERYTLFHTLDQIANLDKKFQYKVVVFQLLKNQEQIYTHSDWEKFFSHALLLRAAWQWFGHLEESEQKLLCQNYFYESLLLDLPLRGIISQYLHDAPGITAYVRRTKMLIDLLQDNKEFLVAERDSSLTFGNLFQRLTLSHTPPFTEDQIRLISQKFLSSAPPVKQEILAKLQPALSLAGHIYAADLINHTYLEEDYEDNRLYKQTIQLMLLYLSGLAAWSAIVNYYKQPNPSVSLQAFFSILRDHEDLSKEETVKQLLELVNLMRENKILLESQDPLFFSESDGKFHWNPPSLESYGGQVPLRSSADRQKQRNIE